MNRWIRTLTIVTICCTGIISGAARGALIDVTIPNVLVETDGASPISKSLIVGLTGTGAEQMGGYTVSIDVVAQVGATGSVSLTGASDIVGQLIDSSNLGFASAGTFDIVADVTASGTVSAVTGDLFEMDFLVGPGTDGIFDVRFLFNPPTFPGSEVQDGEGLPISTDFTNGSITVMVPQPATLVVFLAAASTFLGRRRQASLAPGPANANRGA